MTRSYSSVRPKKNFVYSRAEVITQYGVCENTVSNWITAGLRVSRARGQLFRGAELIRFHADRSAQRSTPLEDGFFSCFRCMTPVQPHSVSLSCSGKKGPSELGEGHCPICGSPVYKRLTGTERDRIVGSTVPKMTKDLADEVIGQGSGGVGNKKAKQTPQVEDFTLVNDPIVHEWQFFAGKYDPKTVDAHLVAIREFEAFAGNTSFLEITAATVDGYRQDLLRRVGYAATGNRLSKSTVQHRAAAVSGFLRWLVEQSGYGRLTRSLADYLQLPRGQIAKALKGPPRPYPTIGEAEQMLDAMPEETMLERRQRAIFAAAFVTRLRADANISQCREHLDFENQSCVQDARQMRAKNGKSYMIDWFPRTEKFRGELIRRRDEMTSYEIGGRDAVFPNVDVLTFLEMHRSRPECPIIAMKSADAVTSAFEAASRVLEVAYSPHSARHCLKALGDQLCTGDHQRKAWSKNLGHSSVHVTEENYAKMTDSERSQLIRSMRSEMNFTDEEKDFLLDFYQHVFPRGTAEFDRGCELAKRREAMLNGADQ